MPISAKTQKDYVEEIEERIAKKISEFEASPVAEACAYALQGGGKRFRPAIVHMIAESIGRGMEVGDSALAIELFHTASLIADDLPCMDNEAQRRKRPSVHRVYGETVALLASYALIAAGYDCIRLNASSMKAQGNRQADEIGMLALENAAWNTGLYGATGGQFLDLSPSPADEESLMDCIQKKTGSLFEIAFVFGWLFGGGDPADLPKIKKASWHFGFSFQIIDDFHDLEADRMAGKKNNYVDCVGEKKAHASLKEHVCSFRSILQDLSIQIPELSKLLEALL